jgi:hypothetical protein
LAAGIAPFIIASNTLVSNLNADLLDGQHGTYYLAAGNISGTTNYIAKFTPNGSSLGNSLIYDNGTNVGIGTTAPGKALDVVGEIQASSYMRSGGFISNSNYGLVATNMALRANADSYINNTSYGFGLGTATPNAKLQVLGADSLNTSFAANIGGSTGTGLVVTNAGNVGIGTTAPTAKLQVGADATTQTYGSLNALEITGSMTIGGYSNTEVLQFRNQASTGTIFGMGLDISNNLYVGHNNPELHLRTNSTDRVTILSGGNVGIGTTNPPTKLSVSGGDITLGSTNTTTAAVLRFMEGSSYGSKYVGLKGPDHLSPADSITFTLPSIYGTAGQILRTAGATGVLSWVDNSGTGMANPMTAKGDLLYGSDGSNPSIPGALAIGAAGQCLVVTGGIPAWGACAGSAAAAGSATQIQFNISPGSFGASADFTYNDTAKTLTVGGDYAGAKTSLSLANPNGGDATSNSINLGNNTGSLMITANSSLFTGAGNYAYITNTNAGPLIFGTSNAERVRIDSVGNVGIGTTVASALLDIGTGTPTTAANGLMFGTDAAANLYRFTASTIKTDGSLVVVGSITGAGGVHTTLTSSGATTLGTGATLTNTFGAGTGAINTFGASGGTNAINGTTTILGITLINSTGTAATTVGNSTGALTIASGGTSGWTNTAGNLTLSTATSGTLALTSAGALNLTAGSASTNNITGTYLINSSGILSLNTTSNAAITTGTGLTTLGGSLTVTGTAWTATPTISGLITATSGLTSTGTLTANGASIFNNTITQAGAYAFSTGTGAVSLNGATTITGANTFSTGTGATTINSTAWTFANDTNFALSGGANGLSFDTNTLSIDSNSHRVGIGTTAPDATLKVVGSICASATDVACYGTNAGSMYAANFIVNGTSHLPDYVFENNYPLLSISDLKTYIAANKHLPGVPSAEEINQNGLNLGQMVPIILEKTEENTLYIIQNNDQISNLVLKTDSSITTLAGLQGSVDANLLVIQGKLDKMDKDASDYQDSVSSEIAKMQKQIDASLLDARLKTLEIALGVNGNNVNILGDLTVNDIAANNLTLSGKLEVDGIVAGVMTVKVVDPERKTIGQAIICQSGKTYNSETKACVACPDGETCDGKSIVVKTKALKENFRIFVTPETATPIIWSVSERENETSFTVKLSEPTTEEIKFNWWIVEEK